MEVIFLGRKILTERSGGSSQADRLRRLFRQRREEEELRSFAAEIEATEEHSQYSEVFWKTMAGLGFIKRFPSPGYEVWEDWREYYLDTCELFMWTEEEFKRYLPEKLCGWALDTLDYLPSGFWKFATCVLEIRSKKSCLDSLRQHILYFFVSRSSNNPQFYEDALERCLMEKEETEKAPLQCEEENQCFKLTLLTERSYHAMSGINHLVKNDVQVKTDIVKSVLTGKLAKGFLSKRWSAIKAIGFGVNAVFWGQHFLRTFFGDNTVNSLQHFLGTTFFGDNTVNSLQQEELTNKSFGKLIGFWALVSPQLEAF